MRFFLSVILIFSASFAAQATDWQKVNWKSGQILGISSRSGLTPVLVQVGTLSKVDHLGIVSVDHNGIWLYEFTNSTGIQKAKMEDVWLRSADRKGNVSFVLGEFSEALTTHEWDVVLQRLERWIRREEADSPRNCFETVVAAFQHIRHLSIQFIPMKFWLQESLNGTLRKLIEQGYPGYQEFPVLASAFSNLRVSAGNLSKDFMWRNEAAFFEEWRHSGDFSKFVRVVSMQMHQRLNQESFLEESQKLISRMETDVTAFKAPMCSAIFGVTQ